METEINKKEMSYFFIEEELKKILKVPFEAPKNQTLVGGLVSNQPKYILYNLGNYRLYFDFNKSTFDIKKPRVGGLVGGLVVPTHKLINKNELLINDFLGYFTIRIKKEQIEVVNRLNLGSWHKIDLDLSAQNQLVEIIKIKDEETIHALKQLINLYGGYSEFKILNKHSDSKIKNEAFIDTIPIKATFQNQVVKKVYKESNIEFSDPSFACNYITNQSIVNHAEDISKSISLLASKIEDPKGVAEAIRDYITITNTLKIIKSRLNYINDLFNPNIMELIKILNLDEKKDLEDHIFSLKVKP